MPARSLPVDTLQTLAKANPDESIGIGCTKRGQCAVGESCKGPPGPPRRACGALREKTPCSRYPVRHPPETGRRRIARTKSKDGKRLPGRRSSRRIWSGVPGIERNSHTDTVTGAAQPPGPRTSVVRLGPQPLLGAERLARPTPRLPDRSDRPYGVVQKQGRGIGLLLAPLPHGSQQRFFFLLCPAAPLLLDRAESTDLFVEGHQVLAQLLEAVKLGDLLLGFTQGGGIRKGLRHGLA